MEASGKNQGGKEPSGKRPSLGVLGGSLGTAAYEFIPVPFLDEWMIKRQRRSMVETILRKRGVTFDAGVPAILAGGGQTLLGRIGSMTRGLVMKPLKKIFRSVLFWLTARNAARTAMVTYFLARFLQHPELAGDGGHLSKERAKLLVTVFREVAEGIDVSAAKGAFSQLVGLFGRSKKASGKELSETIEKASPGFIAQFDAMVNERMERVRSEG